MNPPRILLVDDQRQVSRVLRSALELSSHDYLINDVSSAEEALLEIARGPVDLLVTDLRLPGMSGLELVERVRQINPHSRSILISGDATVDVRARADALGVVAFMRKPIGTNMFLEIVEGALELSAQDQSRGELRTAEDAQMGGQLMDLRKQIGAEAVILIDGLGRVLARAGEVMDLDLEGGMPALMAAHAAAQRVSHFLGGSNPASFQHFDGETHDLYLTNVGEEHSLLIAYRGRQEAGQMGAVVHYGRRAAESLLEAIGASGKGQEGGQQMPEAKEDKAAEEPDEKPEIAPEELEAAGEQVDAKGAESFWEQAVSNSDSRPEAEGDALTYDQAKELGLLDEDV